MSERKMWDQQEDSMIIKIVKENDARPENQKLKWSQIAELLKVRIQGCRRTGKQCRERWYNHLNPAIIKDKELSRSQIDKLFELQNQLGNKWAVIAKQFPGRTDNTLKNFFYSSLRRAIRQVNYFVAHYKKKSNIKPFKHSILTKILNINDEKYRQKLDIKSQKAETLAQNVKEMLAALSLESEESQLDQNDIEFRQKIVRAIQEFNKNCKKRKSKRMQQEEQPDLEVVSNDSNQKSSEMEQARSSRKPQRERKSQNKHRDSEQIGKKPVKKEEKQPSLSPIANQSKKQLHKTVKTQKTESTSRTKKEKQKKSNKIENQNKNKNNWNTNPPFLKSKQSLIDELLDGNNKLKQIESKKSSSKYESRSSGNQQFKLQSSDFMRQSNASLAEIEPRMLTRRSSSQFKSSFLHNIDNWRKMQSKCQDGLFAGDNLHILDPMLQSLNIGDNLQRITDGSVNQSGLFKMVNRESKTENQ